MSSTNPSQIKPASLILVSKPTFVVRNFSTLCHLNTNASSQGLMWGCVGVSFCFVAFRVYVRLRVFRRIFDDDILVILAWLILLTYAILWHVRSTLELVYESYYMEYGGVQPSVYDIQHRTNWLRILFAELFLNIIGLWCIKYAFLAFFLRLGHKVKGQKILWWTIFSLTTAGLAISIGVCYFPCIFATYQYSTSK